MSMLPYLYDVDAPIRLLKPELFNTPGFFPSTYSKIPHQLMPLMDPLFLDAWKNSHLNMTRQLDQLSKHMNQLAVNDLSITTDDEKFQTNIDVQHFAPEEISVKVIDGHVIVEGNHEERHDDHGYVSRRFVRRYALPQGCLPDTVESKLSSDGVLTISAPKVLPLPSTGEKIVPITQTGPIKKQLLSPEPIKEASAQ